MRRHDLVEAAIAAVTSAGRLPTGRIQEARDGDQPRPMPADRLAALTLADGQPLPPSLSRWLAFDESLLALPVEGHRLVATHLTAIVACAFGEDAAAMARTAERTLVTGDCYLLPTPTVCSDDARVFLHAERPLDETGELPVLGVDASDSPILGVFACGFDVYLGRLVGLLDAPAALGAAPPGYEDEHRRSELVALGGASIVDLDDDGD